MVKYEINIKGFRCLRCSHIWKPATAQKPKVCPKCKSPYWYQKRRKGKKNRSKS